MTLDFRNEGEQGPCGPLPDGTVALLGLEVLPARPERQAEDNALISVAKTGLRQLCCRLTVLSGPYCGLRFRQNITLPVQAQLIALTDGQRQACRIGGAMLRAMCLACGQEPRVNSLLQLNGLRFPARVKTRPSQGKSQWANEIALVLTPDKATSLAQAGESPSLPGPSASAQGMTQGIHQGTGQGMSQGTGQVGSDWHNRGRFNRASKAAGHGQNDWDPWDAWDAAIAGKPGQVTGQARTAETLTRPATETAEALARAEPETAGHGPGRGLSNAPEAGRSSDDVPF